MTMQEMIEAAWERRAELSAAKADDRTRDAVEAAIASHTLPAPLDGLLDAV